MTDKMEPSELNSLRQRAEECLAKQAPMPCKETGVDCPLTHELQVYTIELEMQNEELQESQTQLSAALARYESLYEFAPVGYITLTASGQVIKMNLTAATLLGGIRAKLAGQSLGPYFLPTQAFQNHLATTCQAGGNVITEVQMKNPNNGVSDVQLESRCLTPGASCTINTIMTDISKRKALERELQQQHVALETLLQHQVAVQTAAAIAHELNQPLAAISMFSEVALHYLETHDITSPSLRTSLDGVVEQAQRAGKTLHELLEFLQKNKEAVAEPINLNDLICGVLDIMAYDGFGGFQQVLELEPNLPPVLGNYIHIQKVLTNLIRNSVEAMRLADLPIANITITVRTMSEWNMAQVTIRDNGPGLNAEVAKRIFRPFFTTKPQGIGMGLAVSRALIEANGGQLWVEPDGGPGATFHFTLPFATVDP